MKIRIPEKPIPTDGFSGNDILDRKPLADTILNLVSSVEHDLIIGLDAKWGEGKTYFLRQLQAYASTKSSKVIWFDAFKHDLSDDAFGAITGHLLNVLDQAKQTSTLKKARLRLMQTASEVGKVLAKSSVRAAGAYLTGGLLSAEQIQKIIGGKSEAEAIAKGLSELIEESSGAALSTLFNEYSKTNESVGALHSALAKTADVLTEGSTDSKIIFVIDELDRCRPSFAIDIIEVIKHFYNSDRVSFLLAADFRQLETSIRHCYGSEIEANRYLEKFYDIRMTFPRVVRDRQSALAAYAEYAVEYMIDDDSGGQYSASLLSRLVELGDRIDLSIRSFQKVLVCINIALHQTSKDSLRSPPILIALCVTKVLFPKVYVDLASGRGTAEQIMDCFGLTDSDADSDSYLARNIGCWRFCLWPDKKLHDNIRSENGVSENQKNNIMLWADIEARYNISRIRAFPLLANRFVNTFTIPE